MEKMGNFEQNLDTNKKTNKNKHTAAFCFGAKRPFIGDSKLSNRLNPVNIINKICWG
jgi:hypothetical protein